jgi:hypothetical protein
MSSVFRTLFQAKNKFSLTGRFWILSGDVWGKPQPILSSDFKIFVADGESLLLWSSIERKIYVDYLYSVSVLISDKQSVSFIK